MINYFGFRGKPMLLAGGGDTNGKLQTNKNEHPNAAHQFGIFSANELRIKSEQLDGFIRV